MPRNSISAQRKYKSALAVNCELIMLYWQIGREILEHQQLERWDAKVIARLGKNLKQEFPGVGGFSSRNLQIEVSGKEYRMDMLFYHVPLHFDTANETLLSRLNLPPDILDIATGGRITVTDTRPKLGRYYSHLFKRHYVF